LPAGAPWFFPFSRIQTPPARQELAAFSALAGNDRANGTMARRVHDNLSAPAPVRKRRSYPALEISAEYQPATIATMLAVDVCVALAKAVGIDKDVP